MLLFWMAFRLVIPSQSGAGLRPVSSLLLLLELNTILVKKA